MARSHFSLPIWIDFEMDYRMIKLAHSLEICLDKIFIDIDRQHSCSKALLIIKLLFTMKIILINSSLGLSRLVIIIRDKFVEALCRVSTISYPDYVNPTKFILMLVFSFNFLLQLTA